MQKPKTVFTDDLAKAFGAGGMTWGDLPPIVLEQPKPVPELKPVEEVKIESPQIEKQ